MSTASRARFAQIVRASPIDLGLACLLLAAEADSQPEPDIDAGLQALDDLAAKVSADSGPAPKDPDEAADYLRVALADGAGFRGFPEDFADLRSSLLPDVLERRRGLPILLSIVYVEVALRVGIPAHIIALPGRVVIGIGDPAEPTAGVMLDPYDDGRRLRPDDAVALVASMGMRFDPSQLEPADGADILARVLTNIRALASRQQQPRVQLWAVELSMLLPHHPMQLRRERATLRTRLGDFWAASEDLEAYGEVLDPVDPEAAEQVRREARLVRSRLN
jgi:regulator of sirC expression with transglutaminase-like and TPR domain